MRKKLWEPTSLNGTLKTFNPYIYLNALKDPESEDLESDQVITLRDVIKFLKNNNITYDKRALDYFFTFFAKKGSIYLNQLITIFVPNSQVAQASHASYSNLILESVPYDKLQLVISIFIAELLFANIVITEFVERLENPKTFIIDAYFNPSLSFEDKILQVYTSRTGNKDLSESLMAIAMRLDRCSSETKLISNAFQIPSIPTITKTNNDNIFLSPSANKKQGLLCIDPAHKLVKPAYAGREIEETDLNSLSGIIVSSQFISFDHRKQSATIDPMVLGALTPKKIPLTHNDPQLSLELSYSPFQNHDKEALIRNDNNKSNLGYSAIAEPEYDMKDGKDRSRDSSSFRADFVPFQGLLMMKNSSRNVDWPVTTEQKSSNAKFEALPIKVLDEPEVIKNKNPPMTNTGSKNQINIVKDSRHNLPVKSTRESKFFQSKINSSIIENKALPINKPSTQISSGRQTSPIKSTTPKPSPSPIRKSISHMNSKDLPTSKTATQKIPDKMLSSQQISKPLLSTQKLPTTETNISTSKKSSTPNKTTTPVRSTQPVIKSTNPQPQKVSSAKQPNPKIVTANPEQARRQSKVLPTPANNIKSEKTVASNKKTPETITTPSKTQPRQSLATNSVLKKPASATDNGLNKLNSQTSKQKSPSPHKNLIEVQQKVTLEGSIVKNSTTFIRKETEPSNNLPLKVKDDDNKLTSRRNIMPQNDQTKSKLTMSQNSENLLSSNGLFNLNTHLNNFHEKQANLLQEGANDKIVNQGEESLQKSISNFENHYGLNSDKGLPTVSIAAPPLEDRHNKSGTNLNSPFFNADSFRNLLKPEPASIFQNNSSLNNDASIQQDFYTPTINHNQNFFQNSLSHNPQDTSKANTANNDVAIDMEKNVSFDTKDKNKGVVGDISSDVKYNGAKEIDAPNLPKLGLFGNFNERASTDKEIKTPSLNRFISPSANFANRESPTFKMIRSMVKDVLKSILDNIDDVLVRFNSNCSNTQEVSQLLAKYTDTSFTQNFNKIYTNANLSTEYVNNSFLKPNPSNNRSILDRSLSRPLASTTQLFDNLHFNYLNNFTDTKTNLGDAEDASMRKVEVKNPSDKFSSGPLNNEQAIDKNSLLLPAQNYAGQHDSLVGKYISFTKTDENFTNYYLDSPDNKARPQAFNTDSPPVLPNNSFSGDSAVVIDKPSPFNPKIKILDESSGNNHGAKNYLESEMIPVVNVNPNLLSQLSELNHGDHDKVQAPGVLKKINSEISEVNKILNNLEINDGSFKLKTDAWSNKQCTSNQTISVIQELDKNSPNGSLEYSKRLDMKNPSKKNFEKSNFNYNRANAYCHQSKTQSQKTMKDLPSMGFQKSTLTEDSNSPKLMNKNSMGQSAKLEIFDLTNVFSKINSKEDLINKLTSFFKKILVYSSKIESVKSELFQENSRINILEIYELYDENKKGLIGLSEFTAFLADLGIPTSDFQCFQVLEYVYCVLWPEGRYSEGLSLLQFANLFIPFSNDNRFILKQMLELYGKRDHSAADAQPLIQESDFYLMRQIVIFLMRKIEDLNAIIQGLKEYKIEEAFFAITKGEKKDITWKILSEFLEQNEVRFIDEDLVHIFREMKSRNMGTITFQNFTEFFELNIWNNC